MPTILDTLSIQTCVVSYGKEASFAGSLANVAITVTAKALGVPQLRLVWAATGDIFSSFTDSTVGGSGTPGIIVLPQTGQDGFRHGTSTFKDWYYEAVVTATTADGQQLSRTYRFQIPAGTTTLDLDMLDEDGIVTAMPAVAPVPTVTSVNGQTGDVTVTAGGDSDADIAAIVATPTSATAAALAATYATQSGAGGVEFRDRFSDHPDGPLATAITGQPWIPYASPSTAAPTITGGKLTYPAGNTTGATYPAVALARRVVRQGAAFIFQPGATQTANADQGSIAIMAWDGDIAALSTAAGNLQVPATAVHLDISRTSWGVSYVSSVNGPVTSVAAGNFATPLANDGSTVHMVEYVLDTAAGKLYLTLPDGSFQTITDPHFTTVANGRYACWESYHPDATHTLTAFVEVWADSGPRPDLVAAGRLRSATITPLPTYSTEYAPGSNVTYTLAGASEIDAVNVAVATHYTQDRDVWIDCEAYLAMPSGGQIIWIIYINHGQGPFVFGVKGPFEGPVRLRKKYTLPAGAVVSIGAAADGPAGTITMGALNPISLQVTPY